MEGCFVVLHTAVDGTHSIFCKPTAASKRETCDKVCCFSYAALVCSAHAPNDS